MPELPEVETVRLQLLNKVIGKKIAKIEVFHQKTIANQTDFTKQLTGKAIDHIDRIGKLMIFSFSGEPDLFLLVHLKMTGQFFYVAGKNIVGGGHYGGDKDSQNLPNKHTRIAFYFSDKSALFFNDMRLFGYVKTADREEVEKAKTKFGQEPIADNFDYEAFAARLRKRNTSVKAALLDQSFIAGLGNIYVDEALFLAGVRPTRKASKVTKKEALAIAKAGGEIMKESIKVGGTTFQHFLDTGGETGNYTDYLKVFGKQNTKCPVCGTIIKKIRVAGRGTHYCPKCQK
ncbi:MAG: bifunctional DNA-formamidopyrimidine glycosylase/DNA-(apurinic or apyrimidinic site) lyase [Candidatus Nomurabacteria bacterium]|nr:bifunctional DNA-formamidopyrimidine glycosylase/DNA-(apurinic or apyrimidinic site) lyase [Candidatus Nomurabacteria bacterium]USN88016.1 MAG: bifunctional DNA-formamidopyrimidine glycosylase/DNA-(apurinic or apyrimidinic site) lyase [Candidatus Nomurabacteria bacterium]